MLHVTAVLLEPLTVLAKVHVPPRLIPSVLGEIVTEIANGPDAVVEAGDGETGVVPPHPARNNKAVTPTAQIF
jgi:hypothetical protein